MNYSFDADVAIKYGVNEAIMIENIRFWVAKNEANEKHFYKNRYWTYNSIRAFNDLFPFWSENQIRRILNRLIDLGILITDNFNKSNYDRTRWFTLDFQVLSIGLNYQMDVTPLPNGCDCKAPPIPDIKSDIKSDINILGETQDMKSLTKLERLQGAGKKGKPKKQAPKATLEQMVKNFTNNDLVRKALFDYIKVRKESKQYLAITSFDLILDKLQNMELSAEAQVEIIETASRAGYREFYPPKNTKGANFDNTNNTNRKKGVADMSSQEKRKFNDEELAKNNNGEVMEF